MGWNMGEEEGEKGKVMKRELKVGVVNCPAVSRYELPRTAVTYRALCNDQGSG